MTHFQNPCKCLCVSMELLGIRASPLLWPTITTLPRHLDIAQVSVFSMGLGSCIFHQAGSWRWFQVWKFCVTSKYLQGWNPCCHILKNSQGFSFFTNLQLQHFWMYLMISVLMTLLHCCLYLFWTRWLKRFVLPCRLWRRRHMCWATRISSIIRTLCCHDSTHGICIVQVHRVELGLCECVWALSRTYQGKFRVPEKKHYLVLYGH